MKPHAFIFLRAASRSIIKRELIILKLVKNY